jgi:hypothetical protein
MNFNQYGGLDTYGDRFGGKVPLFNDGIDYALDGWLKELGSDVAEV